MNRPPFVGLKACKGLSEVVGDEYGILRGSGFGIGILKSLPLTSGPSPLAHQLYRSIKHYKYISRTSKKPLLTLDRLQQKNRVAQTMNWLGRAASSGLRHAVPTKR